MTIQKLTFNDKSMHYLKTGRVLIEKSNKAKDKIIDITNTISLQSHATSAKRMQNTGSSSGTYSLQQHYNEMQL